MVWKIQLGSVWRVLLADGWHDVAPTALQNSTFDLDAIEYYDETQLIRGDDGFSFKDNSGHTIYGPLSAILALDTTRPPSVPTLEQLRASEYVAGLSSEELKKLIAALEAEEAERGSQPES